MANEKEIKVPDIGGSAGVDVIEVLVKVGQSIEKDTPLVTLESDKASMEIPAPQAGVVAAIHLKVGDKVSEGDLILSLSADDAAPAEAPTPKKASQPAVEAPSKPTPAVTASSASKIESIYIPDIGSTASVDVIDVLVKPGDEITKDQALVTLEGDKATMDIPAPMAGVVETVDIKVGDKVSQGALVLTLKTLASAEIVSSKAAEPEAVSTQPIVKEVPAVVPAKPLSDVPASNAMVFAGPAVRRFARELGVDLSQLQGSGRKSRVSKEDVLQFVKQKMSQPSGGGLAVPAAESIDFSKFGTVEIKALNKIKRLTGVNLHRAWVTIPHVTQFDEADITELEAFRKAEVNNPQFSGAKLTILAFVCKVVARALAVFPQFNASLDAKGENLIYKQYFNVGIAVETPNGLVVPVIKAVDRLSVKEIAQEMARLSLKAREKGLMPTDMNGGCFTVSSLGGIGGTAFTPIVNSPEVAILGLSRSSIQPVYQNGAFQPRLMLPLSLSYDHRVIDGAEAARFTRFLCESLSDLRRILL